MTPELFFANNSILLLLLPLCISLAKGNICYKKISLSKGAHTIQIIARDNAGNSNAATVHVKI
jgi:hypothetical protein